MTKKTVLQTVKFTLFSISAGVIQIAADTLLNEVAGLVVWASYLIALILSVLWNFTFNRRYTFKSANNIPIAMLKVAGFYCVFTPLSTLWTWALTPYINEYIILGVTMIINFVTEFLFCKFIVYRNSEDTNDIAQKEKLKAQNQEETIKEQKDDETLPVESDASEIVNEDIKAEEGVQENKY